jgi:hypothetical protein
LSRVRTAAPVRAWLRLGGFDNGTNDQAFHPLSGTRGERQDLSLPLPFGSPHKAEALCGSPGSASRSRSFSSLLPDPRLEPKLRGGSPWVCFGRGLRSFPVGPLPGRSLSGCPVDRCSNRSLSQLSVGSLFRPKSLQLSVDSCLRPKSRAVLRGSLSGPKSVQFS